METKAPVVVLTALLMSNLMAFVLMILCPSMQEIVYLTLGMLLIDAVVFGILIIKV